MEKSLSVGNTHFLGISLFRGGIQETVCTELAPEGNKSILEPKYISQLGWDWKWIVVVATQVPQSKWL